MMLVIWAASPLKPPGTHVFYYILAAAFVVVAENYGTTVNLGCRANWRE